MRHLLLIIALAWPLTLVLGGCPPDEGDDDAFGDDDDVSGDDDDASGDDDDDDAVGDDDDACADYRAEYPGGPYGFSEGSVLDNFPGMVDGDGNSRDLVEIFEDTSKVALVIANAFDT